MIPWIAERADEEMYPGYTPADVFFCERMLHHELEHWEELYPDD